ncbi:MAG: phage major capsid protein [Xanthomonadaceae bacterium]|nr:phage major capsid protein [Xanthomonadaceae bacterium]
MNDIIKGRTAARYIKALAATENRGAAEAYAEATNWLGANKIKDAIGAVAGTNSPALLAVGADFMAAVSARTIAGRILDRVRRLPVNTPVIRQTGKHIASWVQEGHNIPMSRATFAVDASLPLLKVAGLTAVTKRLAEDYAADVLLTRDLQRVCAVAIDLAFADPGNAGVADEAPASVFHGATEIPSSGSTAAAFRADFLALVAAFNGNLDTAAIVCDTTTALQIGLMPATMGSSVIAVGGESRLMGLPAFFSDTVPRGDDGGILGLIDLDCIDVVGMDQAELAISRDATLMMSDNPDTDAPRPISMWQTNTIGLLASAYANWRAAPGSAAFISGTDYTGA